MPSSGKYGINEISGIKSLAVMKGKLYATTGKRHTGKGTVVSMNIDGDTPPPGSTPGPPGAAASLRHFGAVRETQTAKKNHKKKGRKKMSPPAGGGQRSTEYGVQVARGGAHDFGASYYRPVKLYNDLDRRRKHKVTAQTRFAAPATPALGEATRGLRGPGEGGGAPGAA